MTVNLNLTNQAIIMKPLPKPKVPEYFKDLPDNAFLNSRDVAAIFGYKTYHITQHYKMGRIPAPDNSYYCSNMHHSKQRIFWTVKTIRDWITKNVD